MKMLLVVVLVLSLVAGAAGLVGCGGSVTVKTDDGKIEVSEKDGEVNVETDEGDVELSTRMPTEADIGVPIYPSAKVDENAALNAQSTRVLVIWTEDSTDKVIEWYKEKLSGKPEFQALVDTG